DQQHEQVQVEQDVEGDRANDQHERTYGRGAPARRSSPAAADGLSPMRSRAKMYLTYSDSMSRAVAPPVHHGSARWRSVTTGNGTSATPGSWWAISASARGM